MVKNNYDEKIIKLVKDNEAISLAELDKKGISRQTLRYNLRKLIKEGIIKSYVKISDDKGFTLPRDEELFFTYTQNRFETPQEILKLIDDMCSNDKIKSSQALENFIGLYKEYDTFEYGYSPDITLSDQEKEKEQDEDRTNRAKKLAYALMSGIIPNLKEKVAHHFVMRKEFKEYPATFDELLVYEGFSTLDFLNENNDS